MEHQDSDRDDRPPPPPPALSVNIDQRGQSVDNQTNAGRDVRHDSDQESRSGRRRPPRMYEDELVSAINDLRQQISGLHAAINDLRAVNSTLQTKTALLDYQVSHLNERLRQSGPPWGPAQWFVLAFILTVAAGVAVYIGLAQ